MLGRVVDLIHDGVEAAIALDGVPIGISDGLPKNCRFWLGRYRVSGCPGLENPLVWVRNFQSIPELVRDWTRFALSTSSTG